MSKTNRMNVFEAELEEVMGDLHKTEEAISYVTSQLDLYWSGKIVDEQFIQNITDFFNIYPHIELIKNIGDKK